MCDTFWASFRNSVHSVGLTDVLALSYNMNGSHFPSCASGLVATNVWSVWLASWLWDMAIYGTGAALVCGQTHAALPEHLACCLEGPPAWNRVLSTLSRAELSQARWKIHDDRQLDSPVESATVVVTVEETIKTEEVCLTFVVFCCFKMRIPLCLCLTSSEPV